MAAAIPKLPDISYILSLDHLDDLCQVRDNAITYYMKYKHDDPRHAHGRKAWSMAFERLCDLMANEFDPQSDAERDCMVALAAYELVLEAKHGKKVKATYLRKSILQKGIIEAISSSILKGESTSGLNTLFQMGKAALAFENVVLKHSNSFTETVVLAAENTLKNVKLSAGETLS